ncbi:zinc finger protein 271-like isoform X1 [Etheostoma cragini]|uniref:zinc finger protein 271-like isoform X1 n=1 Tax=Etheostoma cragini TaxID=417921 RepID=UPI00155E4A83|nr:zinc finger protein 271-like isoform X1 [Etheostoma cragini]
MPGMQLLRLLVNERLAAATEEIFGLVEKTIAEYQDEAVLSRRKIIHLEQQIQQFTVLQPEVMLFKADIPSVSEEILPDHFSNVEDNETHDSQQLKQEQVDRCISPDIEPGTSKDAKVRHPKSEPTTNCEPFLSSTAETVSANAYIGDKWNERDDSLSPCYNQMMHQCFMPDLNGDSSKDANVRLTESDKTAQSDCQLFPAFGSIPLTLNDDQSIGSPSDTALTEQEQAQRDEKACRFCGKQFNRDSDLIRHVSKIHMTAKAFKCSECDKEFACRGHLDAHSRIHRGEKPHKCSFCRKSFAQKSNLNVHLRLHTGEKPYFCKTCGKMVTYSYHLQTCGMKEQKGTKSFCCMVCGKQFLSASKLGVHKKNHEARKHHTVL